MTTRKMTLSLAVLLLLVGLVLISSPQPTNTCTQKIGSSIFPFSRPTLLPSQRRRLLTATTTMDEKQQAAKAGMKEVKKNGA
jgi:hypothetical protein